MRHTIENKKQALLYLGTTLLTLLAPSMAAASADGTLSFTDHWAGYLSLILFVLAYALVIGEESLHLRKSKPVIVAAGIIWALIAIVFAQHGDTHTAEEAVKHNLLEFAELFLFLLAAMTYINTMEERGVFDSLRIWLVSRGFSLRTIYWLTGLLAFFISPVADNLTTALLMATVAMAVGGNNSRFVVVACINIVVAANAGGAFSPFGDITTLMVWQKGVIAFHEFFDLFIPSVVNWLVPAIIMSLAVSNAQPEPIEEGEPPLKHGAMVVVGLFVLTIVMAVCAHNFLHLPPVLGMMTGLGFLKFYGYYLKRRGEAIEDRKHLGEQGMQIEGEPEAPTSHEKTDAHYNIFHAMERAEWDTLMFFYGIILCVGGLGTLGYLSLASELMYTDLGATNANILVGLLSSIVDNIPVMFAVLSMYPEMSHGQWMLVTLTAGVGGSLLSIGSAAGVAVMGQARGIYTFFAHLKWTWAIALGYAASIWVHFLINEPLFKIPAGGG
ncbi:MAG: sodium:proton antiporter [Gammaproteobacteria bacterium]|nr:MAG: sodium:proton antiporter [Gammaproteobacteria bacterium]